MLADNPIIVNRKMEVIDGQHRLEIAKQNKLPIYFIVKASANLDEVHLLNANSRSWTMLDYLKSYISKGLEDYALLKEFSDTYKLPLSISMMLLTRAGQGRVTRTLVQEFKDGEFKVTDYDFAVDMANKLSEIEPYSEGNISHHREFLFALQQAYKVMKHEKILNKLQMNPQIKLRRAANGRGYLRQLEDLVNYRSRNRKMLYK